MKTRHALTLAALTLMAAACVPSYHPIYSDDTLVFDERLVGAWKESEGSDTWTFEAAPAKAYELTLTGGGSSSVFEAHLARLGDVLVLDLFPKARGSSQDFTNAHFVKAHTFLRVELDDSKLGLRVIDGEWLGKRLEKRPAALAHVRRDENEVLLTASTAELQAFVRKNADAGLFDEDAGRLERLASGTAAP